MDAAHLYRYCDTGHHDPNGGLLLRRDRHSLFDRFLLAIDPTAWIVRVAPSLAAFPDLARLEGTLLAIATHTRPNPDYLSAHLA
ncbi:HNH endonuclease [Micromonospora sp. NBRC 110038]|uniref:HNH endonuclease n=1 Tax=Micromonospora sp. NBRC 110038 TaxID=1550034 RepID=UPI0035AC27A3